MYDYIKRDERVYNTVKSLKEVFKLNIFPFNSSNIIRK